MWLWTDEARVALAAGSQDLAAWVDVWHSGSYTATLEVVDGSVSMDVDRPVRSNLSATLIDPTGTLSTGDVDDLLDPYECEIAPWRGVRVYETLTAATLTPSGAGFGLQPFGTSAFGGMTEVISTSSTYRDEVAPLGVFGLTSREVSDGPDGLRISIAGQDRAMGYQVPMSSALAIPGGTKVETAIVRLLSAVNPLLNISAMDTGHTCGPLLYGADVDVWHEAQQLAASVGARLFHDRTGQCVLAPMGPASGTAVAEFAEGDGLLLSLSRTEDSDTIRNVVVASTPDGRITAVAEDDNPTSPTFAGGKYKRRVRRLDNQHYSSVKQAQQAASARLAYELGRSETLDLTVVPNPGLDPDDVISVYRPRAGVARMAVVVARVEVPLGADGAMSVGCRRSVLTTDGQVLEADNEEAA